MTIALAVAHDQTLLQRLCDITGRYGVSPAAAATVAQAMWFVEEHSPSLVLTDWHASRKFSESSADLLKVLARVHPQIPVVVYASAIGSPDVGAAICAAHPTALIHDDSYGLSLLSTRVERLLGKNLADLRVVGRSLLHTTSGEVFQHKVGAQLLLAYPNPVVFDRSARTGLHRLRKWLEDRGSPVVVVNEAHLNRHRMAIASSRRADVAAAA